MSQVCTFCKEDLDYSFFGKNKNNTNGRHYICKGCLAEKRNFKANLEKLVNIYFKNMTLDEMEVEFKRCLFERMKKEYETES